MSKAWFRPVFKPFLGLKTWLGPVLRTLLGLKTWLGPVLVSSYGPAALKNKTDNVVFIPTLPAQYITITTDTNNANAMLCNAYAKQC